MPRSGAVGRWHKHGEGADAEDEERLRGIDGRGEVKAEEGRVEMQKIAGPDAERINQIERHVFHAAQRCDARPEVAHHVFSLAEH